MDSNDKTEEMQTDERDQHAKIALGVDPDA